MLVEIAIADAYGAGFEFCSTDKINTYNDLNSYQQHEFHPIIGKYTDDTQMSLAIAELLNDCHYQSINENIIIDYFIKTYKRDPHLGYSKYLQQVLNTCQSSSDFKNSINPLSTRNGAAMRSVPIGILDCTKKIINFSTIQSKITHNSEIAISSSIAVALASHYAIYQKGDIENLKKYLNNHNVGKWDYNWKKNVEVDAYQTVSAAFTCLFRNRNLSSLLIDCISIGGDTDSVASIAIGIASNFECYKKDLPSNLYDNLNEEKFDLNYLHKIDAELYSRFTIKK